MWHFSKVQDPVPLFQEDKAICKTIRKEVKILKQLRVVVTACRPLRSLGKWKYDLNVHAL